LVVKGCDWASLNRAQPLDTSTAADSAASAHRTDRLNRMTDRLRNRRSGPPPAAESRAFGEQTPWVRRLSLEEADGSLGFATCSISGWTGRDEGVVLRSIADVAARG
jgi:hypothetical protein